MAEIEVKLYGKLNIDSKIKSITINAENISEMFEELNKQISLDKGAMPVYFKNALVYINGKRCSSKKKKLMGKDIIWLMSPTMGG